MTHTNLSASLNASTNGQSSATEMDDIRLALSRMASGIKTPKSMAWRFYDAARGRIAQPLGPYPEMAEECIDNNGHYHFIVHPLEIMKAHIRRRCSSKLPGDLKQALIDAKKESDESESCALRIAFAVNGPALSDLASFDREADEAILALEHAKTLVEDKIAEATR